MSKIPLSLYVHFPWCMRKCPYCDFNSYPLLNFKNNALLVDYVKKLFVDLKAEAMKLPCHKLSSIYFGGGTPSLLSPDLIKKIIDKVKSYFIFAANIEITLEVNPGTVNFDLCNRFKGAGINRISLGAQSFSDEKLKSIGRMHDAKQGKEAVFAIEHANFSSFNIDLMFGLPGQDIDNALLDLQIALDFAPPHISWYQLTVESKTLFAIEQPILPNSEELWSIQQAGQEMLARFGYIQYEVSAYSRPGYECRHNINYWQYGDYIGIGAGAHGKVTFADGVIKRYWKVADPKKYMHAQKLNEGEKIVTLKERQFEFMLNVLRLHTPISHGLFYERTGLSITVIKNELEYANELGLIELHDDVIIATTKGRNFLNNLLEIFL